MSAEKATQCNASSQRFLKDVSNNFSIKVQDRPTRCGAQLALFFASKEELFGNMIINGSLSVVIMKSGISRS